MANTFIGAIIKGFIKGGVETAIDKGIPSVVGGVERLWTRSPKFRNIGLITATATALLGTWHFFRAAGVEHKNQNTDQYWNPWVFGMAVLALASSVIIYKSKLPEDIKVIVGVAQLALGIAATYEGYNNPKALVADWPILPFA